MFCGVTSINLDDKGRLAVPTKHREELKECCECKLVLTVDVEDPCLMLYPQPEWEEVSRALDKLPALDPNARILKRMLLGHAMECEMDNQGRFLVPESLRSFARLGKRVALVGQGKKFEIWDDEVWNASREDWRNAGKLEQIGQLSPELASLRF